jgi:hypothetical protein
MHCKAQVSERAAVLPVHEKLFFRLRKSEKEEIYIGVIQVIHNNHTLSFPYLLLIFQCASGTPL